MVCAKARQKQGKAMGSETDLHVSGACKCTQEGQKDGEAKDCILQNIFDQRAKGDNNKQKGWPQGGQESPTSKSMCQKTRWCHLVCIEARIAGKA